MIGPTLTIHAKNDPTAFVSHETAYCETVATAGRADLLVQTFTDEENHSRLSPAEVVAGLTALMQWVESGVRPTSQMVAASCEMTAARHREGCHFDPDFTPPAFH